VVPVKDGGLGLVMAVAGAALWLTTGWVETPIITLSKVGVVLLVLGLIEVAVSGVAIARPSTRHTTSPL